MPTPAGPSQPLGNKDGSDTRCGHEQVGGADEGAHGDAHAAVHIAQEPAPALATKFN